MAFKKETVTRLIDLYNKKTKKGKNECIKFYYVFHGISVNFYFDAYDKDAIYAALILKDENNYYFKNININYNGDFNNFLPGLFEMISYNKIAVNNSLSTFFNDLEQHIMENKGYAEKYSNWPYSDHHTNKNSDIGAYIWHLKRRTMTDEHMEKIHQSMSIPLPILEKIKDAGFNITTTDDYNKKRTLKMILDDANILI